ncbi:MAG: galactose-1-phosphate uridylyltransferase [Rhodomicrobium sp.]
MSELRRDLLTGNWVIIAPERDWRPHNARSPRNRTASAPSFDPACPFCPGNESSLPSIVAEMASAERPGWRTRAVANKFPAVSQHAPHCESEGFYEAAAARGHHEVIIESPLHNREITAMSTSELRDVLVTCRDRHNALIAEKDVQCAFIFRNRGALGGASLEHPHSQIISLEMIPPLVREIEAAMARYYRKEKRCVLCNIIAYEQSAGSRIVGENGAFVTAVPFSANVPCEMWLLPKRHQASFGEIQDEGIKLLAAALRDALIRLAAALNDPPYNYMIDTAAKGGTGAPHLHWRLRIVPQLPFSGGFELASHLPINTHLPEQDAAILHSISVEDI